MTVYEIIRSVHIPVALACVPAFWTAMLSKKGGRIHVGFGRGFCAGMIFAAMTGMVMAGMRVVRWRSAFTDGGANTDPVNQLAGAVFLLYLGSITLVPVVHGWRVARTRRDPGVLRAGWYRAFLFLPMLFAIVDVVTALKLQTGLRTLLLALSPIGVFLTISASRYVGAPKSPPRRWFYEHLASMIAGGIAAHTAGAVFVSSLLEIRLEGASMLVPWLLPTAIGVPAIFIVTARYKRKFKDA